MSGRRQTSPSPAAGLSILPLLAVVTLFAALVVMPGGWNGAFSGIGYSNIQARALGAVFVALLALLVFVPRRPTTWRAAWMLVALIVVRSGLGIVDTPFGWRGEYTMQSPEPAKSAGFAWRLAPHAFRIDRAVAFRGTTFDLQFLNDFHRYNRPAFAPPRAVSQALTFTWTGWFEAPASATLEVFAAAQGTMQVRLDDVAVVSGGATQPSEPPRVAVGPGWHRLTVTNDKPQGVAPAVFARFLLDGRPLDVRPWQPAAPSSPHLFALIDDAAMWLGAAIVLWTLGSALAGAGIRGGTSAAGAVAALAAAVFLAVTAQMTAAPFANLTYELRPGDDHLAYEGLARNIVAEGVLMPEGRAPGQGTPFFFYPLYSYTLAGLHLAMGDSHAVVVLLNAMAAAALPVILWLLGWRHLGAGAQVLGQGALVAFVLRHNARYFESPLTDNLFIPLALGALAFGVHAVRSLRPADAVFTGTAIAVCATTRPSFFLFTAPFVLVLFLASRLRPLLARLTLAGAVAAGYALTLAPVILRNWIMAGQAVAMVTLSHAIPVSLIPPEMQGQVTLPQSNLYSWSSSLSLAWDLIRADPWGVAWLEARKILFTLGLTQLGPGAPPLIPEFPLLCVAGVLAVALGRVPWRTAAVLGAFVLSHLAAIVVAYPWTYGYKTILPVHLVFLFCAVHLVRRHEAPAHG